MHHTKLSIVFIALALILSACNLGAEPTQSAGTVIEQATIVVQQATNTPQPSVTPTPEIEVNDPIPVNNSNTDVVPVACNPRTDWSTYTVVAGDTLSRIANRGNTTVSALVSGNCLTNSNLISTGQILYVPFAVIAPSPVIPTVTPNPVPVNNTCRIAVAQTQSAYDDQTYTSYTRTLQTGTTYPITGFNQWSYRIQYDEITEVWIQRRVADTEIGDCSNIFEVGLSYRQGGASRYNICYFRPSSETTIYYDQALTHSDYSLDNTHFYMVDARSNNGYRLVGGYELVMPVWVSSASGTLEGDCDQILDMDVSTTLNGARATHNVQGHDIAFDYPSNWVIEYLSDGIDGVRTGTMPLWGGYPTAMAIPEDVVYVNLTVVPDHQGQTPLEYAQAQADFIEANPSRVSVLTQPEAITLPSGLEAVHMTLHMANAPSETYYFQVDGKLFSLSLYGNADYGQSVVDSIRET